MNKTGQAFVYFIVAEDVQRLKIGLSYNLDQRLKDLQAMSPIALTVLKTVRLENIYQARKTERMFHSLFESTRHHGEWFSLTQEMRDRIDSEVSGIEKKQRFYDVLEYRILSSPTDSEDLKLVIEEE